MTEELCEYLNRIGWNEDIADEIAEAYLNDGIEGVREYAIDLGPDYEDEIVRDVEIWINLSGEDNIE